MINIFARAKEKVTRSGAWPLDLPLVSFSKHLEDAWTLSDAFQGGAIMGQKGNKTSGSGSSWLGRFSKADWFFILTPMKLIWLDYQGAREHAGLRRGVGSPPLYPGTVMLRRLRSLIDNVSSM